MIIKLLDNNDWTLCLNKENIENGFQISYDLNNSTRFTFDQNDVQYGIYDLLIRRKDRENFYGTIQLMIANQVIIKKSIDNENQILLVEEPIFCGKLYAPLSAIDIIFSFNPNEFEIIFVPIESKSMNYETNFEVIYDNFSLEYKNDSIAKLYPSFLHK